MTMLKAVTSIPYPCLALLPYPCLPAWRSTGVYGHAYSVATALLRTLSGLGKVCEHIGAQSYYAQGGEMPQNVKRDVDNCGGHT